MRSVGFRSGSLAIDPLQSRGMRKSMNALTFVQPGGVIDALGIWPGRCG